MHAEVDKQKKYVEIRNAPSWACIKPEKETEKDHRREIEDWVKACEIALPRGNKRALKRVYLIYIYLYVRAYDAFHSESASIEWMIMRKLCTQIKLRFGLSTVHISDLSLINRELVAELKYLSTSRIQSTQALPDEDSIFSLWHIPWLREEWQKTLLSSRTNTRNLKTVELPGDNNFFIRSQPARFTWKLSNEGIPLPRYHQG